MEGDQAMADVPDLQRRQVPGQSRGPRGNRTPRQHPEHRFGVGQGRCAFSRQRRTLQGQASARLRTVNTTDEHARDLDGDRRVLQPRERGAGRLRSDDPPRIQRGSQRDVRTEIS